MKEKYINIIFTDEERKKLNLPKEKYYYIIYNKYKKKLNKPKKCKLH